MAVLVIERQLVVEDGAGKDRAGKLCSPQIEVTFEACAYQYFFAVNRTALGGDADSLEKARKASSTHTRNPTDLGILLPKPRLETDHNEEGEFHILGDPDFGWYTFVIGT